ncbi:MAG TPA: pyridine nucleotide-disulfide oxidoreductase [Lentisphaeria bacterium]|nr:MAG: pyridine nucleotide-disulfide oxidoreductase [Lentisphaerae bacterium GWF2_38_69]HBM16877.1 pyridine nucleotide-disulfide oxidoreductase [Lentisphaeria bacterium]
MKYDVVIVGSGPAGLGTAFELIEKRNSLSVLILDKERICSGGLLNDCKQNYTFPIGFTEEYWTVKEAEKMLEIVEAHLNPKFLTKTDLEKYQKRAERVSSKLVNIRQSHVGTDKSKVLIDSLLDILRSKGVEVRLKTEIKHDIDAKEKLINIENSESISYDKLIIAPGRKGFSFLQDVMNYLDIKYSDNTLDVGIRVETRFEHYPIVKDYYDPKFYFPGKVRTFCTNSGFALVVKENYHHFHLVNGHALSTEKGQNGLVNFAMLKSIGLEAPVRSGQQMAVFLARLANEIGGGKPIMQRVGDFRAGKRSRLETFNLDLYDFKNTCDCTAGDLGLAAPSKIMRDIWKSMKLLDSIMPGLLHPSTIMYYPEIKMYANKPEFIDEYFAVTDDIYLIGDGAGTSRGITGAWASGIRAAQGILDKID